jgi:MFS family permease
MAFTSQPTQRISAVAGATAALTLLTALNIVKYLDAYILPGVQEQIKQEFHVSDAALGSLTLWFFVTYMLSVPLTGWIGDRLPRKHLMITCAVFISAINILTGTVHAFGSLLIRHAVLGVGEASLGIYALALLADFYPEEERNRVVTIFYSASPVGAALGNLIGEIVSSHFGWRMAFYVSAVPGFLIAALIFFLMREPARGASDAHENGGTIINPRVPYSSPTDRDKWDETAPASRNPTRARVLSLATNAPYLYATLGMAMITFSLGGIGAWMPSFLQRSGLSPSTVGLAFGGITAGAGLGGTAFGGWLAHRWLRTNRRALFLISAWSALLTIPFAALCFFGPHATMVPALGMAMFCSFLGTGPLNAAIVNAVPATVRATAIAMQLFLIHALGDTPSPRLIGMISDHSSLATGLSLTLVSMLLATVFLFLGARSAPLAAARFL